jgi:hypothetical protein
MVILKEIKLYHEFRFEDFISLYMSSIEICISKIMITELTYGDCILQIMITKLTYRVKVGITNWILHFYVLDSTLIQNYLVSNQTHLIEVIEFKT